MSITMDTGSKRVNRYYKPIKLQGAKFSLAKTMLYEARAENVIKNRLQEKKIFEDVMLSGFILTTIMS